MNRKSQAVLTFKEGFSCSQAILAAFSEEFGLSRETALRISQGFGAGMARMAETCGALTGAIMAIGLKHGRTRIEDDAAKEKTYALVLELMRRFRSKHGALRCRDLLGCDIGTPEGMKVSKEKKFHDTLCPSSSRRRPKFWMISSATNKKSSGRPANRGYRIECSIRIMVDPRGFDENGS